jgi:DNA-binding NarL/FixJ family response regulator
MSACLNVVILDDHPITLDGYEHRLGQSQGITIVGTATFGEDLEPLLRQHRVDVLILDVTVPTSADNPNPYPILSVLPSLLDRYPNLAVLIVSMHAESGLIKAVMKAGAAGYILKEDRDTLSRLAEAIRAVAHGDICMSPLARQQWLKRRSDLLEPLTPRQLEALSLCAAYPDERSDELARRMFVTGSSLRNLLAGAYLRLNVSTRAAAVEEARRRGLITPHPPRPNLPPEN